MTVNGDSAQVINSSAYSKIANSSVSINGMTGVPLEEFLYLDGIYPVTSVSINGRTYNWSWLASTTDRDQPMLVMPNGSIFDGQSFLRTNNIVVQTTDQSEHTSLDIEPSLLYALGLGGNGSLIRDKSDRIILFYVDAWATSGTSRLKVKASLRISPLLRAC
jgi:hypothetical protein